MNSKKCLEVLKIFEEASKIAVPANVDHWIHQCQNYITLFGKDLKNQNLPVGGRQRIQASISLLHTYCERLREKKRHYGGSLASASPGAVQVVWKDVESAFNNRIQTGVIVNLNHKDPREFLTAAKSVAITHLQTALQKQGNMKTNGVLACKFQIIKSGEMVEETKYFNTRNTIILTTTNLNE